MARLKKRAMDRRRALKVIGATGAWTVLGLTVTVWLVLNEAM